jgi:hypothetical protein
VDGLAARLDARGEDEREGKRERLRSGFIGRRSAVEREGEVHGRPQTNDAGRAATTISGDRERLGQMAGQRGKAGRGQRSLGKRRHRHWCSAHGWRSGGGASGREKSEQSRAEGLEVDERTDSKFSKNTGTPL